MAIKISASNFGGPSPLKFWNQKNKFSTTPFCDFIANISGLQQDIVNRKTALQTAITAVHAYQIWFRS